MIPIPILVILIILVFGYMIASIEMVNVDNRYFVIFILAVLLFIFSLILGTEIQKKRMTKEILSGKYKITEKTIKVLEEK